MGAHLSHRGFDRELARLQRVLRLAQLPVDRAAAERYAEIRARLQPLGQPIGERDRRIAAIGRSRGLTLVTQNTDELGRVPDLCIADWEPE